MKKKPTAAELDDLLDQALDDFEDEDLLQKSKNAQQGRFGDDEESTAKVAKPKTQKEIDMEKLEHLMSGMDDPNFGSTLQSTLRSLSNTADGNETVDGLFDQITKQFGSVPTTGFIPLDENDAAGIEAVDITVASTSQLLGQAQRGMEGFEVSKMEEVGESMMEDMMAQFEALGEKEDYNEVVDGIMRQLLARDLMYVPMKQICDKFPEWLAIHRSKLTEADYTNYGKQYQVFQKLLAVYDTEPDNFPRLMELMFDVQLYGQPPADIIKDLAPGLQFDENGMPIMPNMGSGMMPEMPGGPTLPNTGDLAFNMANGQCIVM